MRDLMNVVSSQGEQTMTSRDIAELTGKRHDHLMRDCNKLNEFYVKNNRPHIWGGVYLDANNQERPQFELTKRQCLDLCMGYSLELRIAVTDKWEELEEAQQNRFNVPKTYLEALRANLESAEQNQRLSDKNLALNTAIENQKPKVEFAETLMNDTNTVRKVSQAAKVISNNANVKIGQKTLYDYMRSIGLVFKGSTEPTQEAINKGYLVLKENQIKTKYGIVKITPQTLVTPKGLEYLLRKLKKDMSNGQFNMFN